MTGAGMDFSILQYHFMQNAILAGLFGGITCSVVGVFVVTMHLSFIGVCIAHAAFAGALLGLWLGFNPLIGALLFSLASAAIIGPVADRGELNPDTSIGIVFSLMLGLAFLFMGLMPGAKTEALNMFWGSILTVTQQDIIFLAVITGVIGGLVAICSGRGHTGDSHFLRLAILYWRNHHRFTAKHRWLAYLQPYSQSRSRCLLIA